MNFEQATQALDTLTQALKNGEQKNIISDKELNDLRSDKEHYLGRLQELEGLVSTLRKEKQIAQSKYEGEAYRNGMLTEKLRGILKQVTNLASDAVEGIKAIENTPEPMLSPPKKPEVQVIINENRNEQTLLDKFIARDNEDLRDVPVGQAFILDPPATDKMGYIGLKNWYRAHGKIPGNWRQRPSMEFTREIDGKKFLRFIDAKEDKETIPFRTEENKDGNSAILQKAFPPDDGQELPKFLTQPRTNGNTGDDDIRGQS